ncbi:Restriction endonuclease [Azospirillaceae bacterium]
MPDICIRPKTQSITRDVTIGAADPLDIRSGPSIVPIERIKLFSASDWEGFVNEWVVSLSQYERVERTSGPGDMGCDVVGIVNSSDPHNIWDNYQCKHYEHPLRPSDTWVELAKLCYYTFKGEYSLPRRYYFVSPRGVGTSLSKLLKYPTKMKEELLTSWDKNCSENLVKGVSIKLDSALRSHIQDVDFSIFCHVPPLELIEGHAKTRFFAVRFGLGLPSRPPVSEPPNEITVTESRYVKQLLAAYQDNLNRPITSVDDLNSKLARHFSRARESFYCAEALRNFSRDTLPDGAFENLQNQIYDGVIDICEADHPCGLTRVDETTKQAMNLAITSSALLGRTEIADRRGICHQLANENRLVWVRTDG